MKSNALNEILKPLHRLQATEIEQWQAAHEGWAIDAELAGLQSANNAKRAKGLASKDLGGGTCAVAHRGPAPRPNARRFIVNDATLEKLVSGHRHDRAY